MITNKEIVSALQEVLKGSEAEQFADALKRHKKNKVWICGNGGSASNSIHLASDLMSLGFDVVCMNTNISVITALTNDFGWGSVYVRQMTHFKPDDVLVVVSVHGGVPRPTAESDKVWSDNLVRACKCAKQKKGLVLALLGGTGGEIKGIADLPIVVPHEDAYVVEGIHSVLAHLMCSYLKG